MPFKASILKCQFCDKSLKNRAYYVKKNKITYRLCSACKFTFNILHEEVQANRLQIIRKMINSTMRNKRHCTICKYFRVGCPDNCRAGMKTGVGYATSYIFSYANHGCTRFCKINIK